MKNQEKLVEGTQVSKKEEAVLSMSRREYVIRGIGTEYEWNKIHRELCNQAYRGEHDITSRVSDTNQADVERKERLAKKKEAKRSAEPLKKQGEKKPSMCAEIRALFAEGKTKEEVVALNKYHPGTIGVQYGKWRKEQKNG